ncbi:hypothetical protein AMS68_006464 [Peltaster fructicola]|uniref:Rhodanese domain-containing protein n=1 Tax=Peltaster fructicola TaxID=286661 RepID=A0A6H0Y1T4_9PEZI|nr:hypothetical protein AMS68_006464 [Peltaster fructicola]
MREYSLSDLKYISREALAAKVRSKDEGLAVIDVRDSDYIGGHILNGQNIPTSTHEYRMPELVRQLVNKNIVVFHCTLSQQRGPKSALLYLRERERLQARPSTPESANRQKVYVLDGGFSKWQEKYGKDTEVTEGYLADLWQD